MMRPLIAGGRSHARASVIWCIINIETHCDCPSCMLSKVSNKSAAFIRCEGAWSFLLFILRVIFRVCVCVDQTAAGTSDDTNASNFGNHRAPTEERHTSLIEAMNRG